MTDYDIITLDNGIRVAFKPNPHSHIVHCGYIIDVGSRDEQPGQEGLAHFWEHMVFKGTSRRNSFQIINRLESVGGELNAYTTKEKICFYASVLDQFFPQAVDLLTDITFGSTFPKKQLEVERGVILEEMSLYEDTPEDALQDVFDEVIYGKHPLGNNILGSRETVRSFSREDMLQFVHQNLRSEQIIFSIVGNLPMKKVKYYAEKFIAQVPVLSGRKVRAPFEKYDPKSVKYEKPITQAHCAIGGLAYPINHKHQLDFFILMNLLGGPAMNSRLNMALREKNGLVYAIEASYQPYSDTGSMGIFFATEPNQINRAIRLVMKEIKKLREQPLGIMQLHRAKAQIKGQLAMGEENSGGMMLMMGKNLLELGKMDSINSIFKRIESISAERLMDIANETLEPSKLSILTFEPD
jgi:predicted Zn-dependent peptidase